MHTPASQSRRLATGPPSPRCLTATPARYLRPTAVHAAVPAPTSCCPLLLPLCPCPRLAVAPGVVPLLHAPHLLPAHSVTSNYACDDEVALDSAPRNLQLLRPVIDDVAALASH
ncbi:hypothetical protein NL676_024633 [Syzygium grande]|nr:hypothetical protein NL676_024633 [Syzygium grande]